ncbi:hypothetical protein [Serinicoccus hydrothermalis]|uniref:hypothetical protein n=1 Tax=Serinicoccus hydrothermalis TaxID=1758689 RepID=UPI000AAC232A|nr:hypothetical protein [Serinicoccus hydrothermalis]
MKITARFGEGSGRVLRADDDHDWCISHPAEGPRPRLFCPDIECGQRLIAVERARDDGVVTRFFRYARKAIPCGHLDSDTPVEVSAHSGTTGPETDEHAWLKKIVHTWAIEAGYACAEVETVLSGGIKADVFVPGACRGRVEIQRVATDIEARSAPYDDVLWLLRQADSDANARYMFDMPCVQVRILVQTPRGFRPGAPWSDSEEHQYKIMASSTVLGLNPRRDEPGESFFESRPMPLPLFLRQVWGGVRRWHPRSEPHYYGGWILDEDYRAWQRSRSSVTPAPPRVTSPRAQTQCTSTEAEGSTKDERTSSEKSEDPHPTPPQVPAAPCVVDSPGGQVPASEVVGQKDRGAQKSERGGRTIWERFIGWFTGGV